MSLFLKPCQARDDITMGGLEVVSLANIQREFI